MTGKFTMCRFILRTITLLCVGIVVAGAAEQQLPPPLILAVHPYLPNDEIHKRFTPLAEYLGQRLGRPVQVRVGRDYEQHVEAIGLDSVDIAFMGPSSYVLLGERYGHKPLLARIEINGKPRLSGYIITSVNSALRKLEDLRGKRFAFVDPDSTMGMIVPRYVMQQAGIELKTLGSYQFLGGHKNVALGILSGDFDAGAVKSEVYEELAPRGLRVLAKLPEVSEHLFVTRVDLPAKEIELLRQALLQLKQAPNGVAIMRAINKDMTAMAPVVSTDYDNLRKIQRAVEAKRN